MEIEIPKEVRWHKETIFTMSILIILRKEWSKLRGKRWRYKICIKMMLDMQPLHL